MIFNIIRIIIIAGIFTILGVMFRGSFITDHQLRNAKQQLSIHSIDHIYNTKNYSTSSNTRLTAAPSIDFFYYPESLVGNIGKLTGDISDITGSFYIQPKLASLAIEFYQKSNDVRGNMKSGTIHLYNVENIPHDEMIGVFVHELAHHIDIYTLVKKVFQDPSSEFYNISWLNTTTIKGGEKIKDFVSGYAMSNKYEDFAESLTYYIFANEEMRNKGNDSFSIKQKYQFFEKNLFKKNEFKNTNFSLDEKKRYYWDITKKGFDIQKFLEYLKKQV